MRILISADIEGVAGVVAPEQTRSGNPDYERARRWLTQEVNAAIRAGMDGQQTFWASEGGIEIGARWQPNPVAAEAEAARAVLWATAAAQRDCQRERQPQRNARGGADDRCR